MRQWIPSSATPPHCAVRKKPQTHAFSLTNHTERVNELMNELLNQYRAILAVAREDEHPDYSESAQKELAIKEGAMAIVWSPDVACQDALCHG
jgi:hypothetical protein